MPKSAQQRLKHFVRPSLDQLGISLAEAQLDQITQMVTASMSGEGRSFHTPEHVIEVGSGEDAIAVLAALFHDLVYFQVDRGIPSHVAPYLVPLVQEKAGTICVGTAQDWSAYPAAQIVLQVFGMQFEQRLALASGQNEFLSALVAARVLEGLTSLRNIAQVAVCIEATIPFRAEPSLELPASRLRKRLEKLNTEFNLGMNARELSEAIRRSVRLANRDVAGFGAGDAVEFFRGTWELVPETDPVLRTSENLSLRSYRDALGKMEAFFANLNPSQVFQVFEGEPAPAVYGTLFQNAQKHIELARVYFKVKLIAVGILEGLAQRHGIRLGPAALISELGEVFPVSTRSPNGMEKTLLELLELSSESSAPFGFKKSPLSAYLVRVLGLHALLDLWPLAKQSGAWANLPAEVQSQISSSFVGTVGKI